MRRVSCAARRSAALGGVAATDFFAAVFLALPVLVLPDLVPDLAPDLALPVLGRLGFGLRFAAVAGFFCFARESVDLDRVFGPC